jgi:hypothetical protein
MRYLLIGMGLGAWLAYSAVSAASLPQYLLNGRTTGGVNVPVQVAADGTLQTN